MPPPYPQWGQQPRHYDGPGLPPPGWTERTAPLAPIPPAPYTPGRHPAFRPEAPLPYFPPRPRRRRWPWWVAGGTLAALGALAAILGAAGAFTTYVFHDQALELGVYQILSSDYDLRVTDVQCPDAQPIEPGHTFTCTVSLYDEQGQRLPAREVTITVTDERGTYTVSRPTER